MENVSIKKKPEGAVNKVWLVFAVVLTALIYVSLTPLGDGFWSKILGKKQPSSISSKS